MKVAILAGGSGTRLWPLSREDYPKQFIKINSEYSFFQRTVLRILGKFKTEDILISSNKNYKFHIICDLLKVLKEGQKLPHLIFEPVMKNTFGALIAILNYCLKKLNLAHNEVLLLLPSDHLIEPEEKFYAYLDLAEKYCKPGKIVLFGIKPRQFSNGFGYIKRGQKINKLDKIFKVEKFIEKPSLDVIKKLLKEGNCYLNSGIFCFKIGNILNEIEAYDKKVNQILKLSEESFLKSFHNLPEISIDHAIMERTRKALVIEMSDLYWNDIGSFSALYEILDKDENGNVRTGDVVIKDARNSFLISNKRLVSAISIKDLLVVETEDALLIAPKDSSQKIKNLVLELKANKRKETLEHLTHYRPWGCFTILEEGERYKIKHVIVNPYQSLSLQLHRRRSEHWIVIKGVAKVKIGKVQKFIHENESAYVEKSCRHRLENPGKGELELIEVQNGEYLGEDDIERFEDRYHEIR